MLTNEENELICRVGAGTPMGNLMRHYWMPGMLSSELPHADGEPVRVLLLGERLVAFRDSNGKVGMMQDACPHRGASMFFGRNEEAGLRCVYHGWKFDATGACIDMPNEPAESNFKHKIHATAYPCVERNGAIWTYMGPDNPPPPLPDIEANMSEGHHTLAIEHDHNWLQVLEGTIDTIHAPYLHSGSIPSTNYQEGTFEYYHHLTRTARFEVMDTPAGVCYGAHRDAAPGMEYWRIAQFMMPIFGMSPTGGGFGGVPSSLTAAVPMDDENTLYVHFITDRATAESYDLAPNTTGWNGRFRGRAQPSNDFLLDRAVQKRNQGRDGYTGLPGARNQDRAITSSMGTIANRTIEHLGQTDSQLIRTRRRLIQAARALAESGTLPPGAHNPEYYRVRSGEIFLPKGADWVKDTEELRKAFVDRPKAGVS